MLLPLLPVVALVPAFAACSDFPVHGVRRIQEIVSSREETAIVVPEGEPSPLELPYERISLQPFEAADMIVGGLSAWTQREYFWAPGGGGGGGGVTDGYVDELLAQVTRYGKLLYSLLDANYNVVAVCRDPNDPNATTSEPLAEQYVWSPYGEPLAVEVLDEAAGGMGQPAANRIGHQGLPFHRLDGTPADPPLVASDPLTGTGYGLYFNRARWYEPSTGRFLQADMNETALPLVTALVMNGESVASLALSMFSASGHFADGMNLYAYLQSNPGNSVDPVGLFDLTTLMGGSLVGNDLNLTTLDVGFSFMDAMRGFAALVEQRNAAMSEFADMSAAGEIDAALSMINASQVARRAMLTAGAVTVGLQLARLGFAAGRSLSRWATGRSFGSFAALKAYLAGR